MNDFVITTDTSADLPSDFLEKNQISTISLYYIIDEITYGYQCTRNLTIRNFYDKMKSGSMPKTQQADPEQAKDIFTSILKRGKDIL